MTDEQKVAFAIFRLAGIRTSWSVYFSLCNHFSFLKELEEDTEGTVFDYFRRVECNILSCEMTEILKELIE
jgi:hypothetical protein